MNETIIQVITLLRGTILCDEFQLDTASHITTEIYTQGNCGNFAKALSIAFNGEVVLVNERCHVVMRLNNQLYDITGNVTHKYTVDKVMGDDQLIDYIDNYSFDLRGPIT